jgi:hypothetical protein
MGSRYQAFDRPQPHVRQRAAGSADFPIFTRVVEKLEGGLLMSSGSATMGPEVFLKALAMARNVAHQEGRSIRKFSTAAFDTAPDPGSDFRPDRTMPTRTAAGLAATEEAR